MTQVIEISCFELTQPDSGGMRDERVALIKSEVEAKKWVSQAEGWPRSYRKYEKTIIICDTIEDFDEQKRIELRKRALSKLTLAEIEALGL